MQRIVNTINFIHTRSQFPLLQVKYFHKSTVIESSASQKKRVVPVAIKYESNADINHKKFDYKRIQNKNLTNNEIDGVKDEEIVAIPKFPEITEEVIEKIVEKQFGSKEKREKDAKTLANLQKEVDFLKPLKPMSSLLVLRQMMNSFQSMSISKTMTGNRYFDFHQSSRFYQLKKLSPDSFKIKKEGFSEQEIVDYNNRLDILIKEFGPLNVVKNIAYKATDTGNMKAHPPIAPLTDEQIEMYRKETPELDKCWDLAIKLKNFYYKK